MKLTHNLPRVLIISLVRTLDQVLLHCGYTWWLHLMVLELVCPAFMPVVGTNPFLTKLGIYLTLLALFMCVEITLYAMLLYLQAERANSISQNQGLGSKVKYQVADALHQPFRDGQFDLIWSMESGEHMPDKAQFISELARVCKPGGKILIVTWCHRCFCFTRTMHLFTGLLFPPGLISRSCQ